MAQPDNLEGSQAGRLAPGPERSGVREQGRAPRAPSPGSRCVDTHRTGQGTWWVLASGLWLGSHHILRHSLKSLEPSTDLSGRPPRADPEQPCPPQRKGEQGLQRRQWREMGPGALNAGEGWPGRAGHASTLPPATPAFSAHPENSPDFQSWEDQEREQERGAPPAATGTDG